MLLYIIFAQGLVRPILAYSVFQPNCTAPLESTNFVRATNVRGTLDILWTSLFTLITCCWTVQHLNIPRKPKRPTWPEGPNSVWLKCVTHVYELMKFYILGVWPKIKWTLVTLVLPEFLVGKAVHERHLAKRYVPRFRKLADSLDEDFRWMGKHWTITHSFYANMGGFVVRTQSNRELHDIPLNCKALLQVLHKMYQRPRRTRIFKIPRITEEEINDKSKSDLLIKVITIGQLVWFFTQVVVRGLRGLVISQLEIAVLAYAACTICVFFLCLSKPQDVQVPTMLPAGSSPFREPIVHAIDKHRRNRLLGSNKLVSWFGATRPFAAVSDIMEGKGINPGPLPNDAVIPYIYVEDNVRIGNLVFNWIDIGCFVAGIIFGGIHCAAWTSHFPTPTERVVWQIACVCIVGLLPILIPVKWADRNVESRKIHHVMSFLEVLICLGYFLARLYLIVEIFRTLCFQPPSAFIATWTSEMPHIS
ncbi:hypothetical protein F4805DRAFT_472751 [Annulohypoxylon moriforme]|nr:hypothetical protein F4805DRAFT_472751 [Annulohypoxylon moriforme]